MPFDPTTARAVSAFDPATGRLASALSMNAGLNTADTLGNDVKSKRPRKINMSTTTEPPGGSDLSARPLSVRDVSRRDFSRRLIENNRATALHGAPSFQFIVRRDDTGTTLYLEDAPGTFLRCADHALSVVFQKSQLWVIDSKLALARCEEMFNWLADRLWHRVMKGEELEPRDGVFLNRWVGLRTRPHHLELDEAERLFGEMPRVTTKGGRPNVEWEAPDRLAGDDPDFQRRKLAAEATFDLMSLEALERYAGAVNVASSKLGRSHRPRPGRNRGNSTK